MKSIIRMATREYRQSASWLSLKPTGLIVIIIILLLATWLCVDASAQSISNLRRIDSPSQTPAIKEKFVTVERLHVRYIESGRGPAVVMIHGNAGSIEDFEFGTIQALALNYRVVAVDRPGHGKSDRPIATTVNVEYQARLLHQVLLSLGVTQPVLIGHSWGAALALSYALQYATEVSALILIAPAAYPDAGESRFLQVMNKPPVIGDVPLMLGRSILGRHILKGILRRAFSPQQLPEKYFRLVASSWLGRSQLKAYLDDESNLNASLRKLSKHYSEISIPVVILTGDHDQVVSPLENAYRLKDSIANSQLIELKNTGHEIPQTRPESIGSALSLISSSIAAVTH
jgi:pimeloyl-ACP methyl ester carboxylesterase